MLLHFVCSGNGTRQIVILEIKIKPVSVNAAANSSEYIVWSDDAIPTLFAQCSWRIYSSNLSAWLAAKCFVASQMERAPIAVYRLDCTTLSERWSVDLERYRFQLSFVCGNFVASFHNATGWSRNCDTLPPLWKQW